MKSKLLPLVLILLFVTSTSFCQLPFKVGVRAGLNIANLSIDPALPSAIDKSSIVGAKYGVMAEFGFVPMFAIQVEPMIVRKGTKISGLGIDATSKLSYLDIPILLKLKIPTPVLSPYVFAGPDLGFLLSATGTVNGVDSDIKDQFNSIDFTLDIGAGLSFDVAPLVTLMIDARYSLGLPDIYSDTGKQILEQDTGIKDQKAKTTGIQILAGIMFGL